MASWTDDLMQFNPYIQEVPVDDMVRVGMMKQEQYNQGVKAVQGMIDHIAGLPITRDVDKEYLNSRLNQLTTEVGKVAGADFSKSQLISSIGGLATQVSGDKLIRNAVASTTKYQAALQKLEKAQAEGKSSPANEFALQQQAEKWLNGGINDSFNGDYEEFFDIDTATQKVINEVRNTPGATIRQNPYKVNPATGQLEINEVMVEEEAKGVSPQKIRDAIATVLADPRAQKQLHLNAQYEYRGMDSQALFNKHKENYQHALATNQKKVTELTQTINNGTEAERKIALAHLKEIQDEASSMIVAYNADVDLLESNPDAFKDSLYARNYAQRYANSHSYVTESTKILTNPLWSSYMDMLKYNLDVKQYDLEVLKEERRAIEAAKKNTPKPGEEGSIFGIPSNLPVDTSLVGGGREKFVTDMNAEMTAGEIEMKKYINRMFDGSPTESPYVELPNGNFRFKSQENGDRDSIYKTNAEARIVAGKTFLENKLGYDKGTTTNPKTVDYFSRDGEKMDYLREKKRLIDQIDARYAPAVESTVKELKEKGIAPTKTITDEQGKEYVVNALDLVDLGIGDADAKNRIVSRIGEGGYNKLKTQLFKEMSSGATSRGGMKVPTPLTQYYEQVKGLKGFENASQAIANRDAEFTKLQNDFINATAPFVTDKPDQRRRWNREFRSAIQAISQAGGGLGEGVDVDDVLDLLNADVGEGKGKETLLYSYTRDWGRNQSYLVLGKGDGEEITKIPITDEQAARIPQVEINDPFYEKYEKRLLGGETTDKGEGRATAISVAGPNKYQNYNVKVHLDKVNGAYALRMFIFDKKTGKWADNVPFDIGLGLLSRDQVMTAMNNLSEAQIERLLKNNGH